MKVGAAFVADPQSFELVKPGEGALDDPAGLAQAGTVGDAAPRDERLDATLPQQPHGTCRSRSPGRRTGAWACSADVPANPVFAGSRPAAGSAASRHAGSRRSRTRPAGFHGGRRSGGAWSRAGHGRPATARRDPPLRALTWEPSIAQSSISSKPALRSSARSSVCSRGQTPASVQSRSRPPGRDARAAHHARGHVPPGHTLAQYIDDARQCNTVRHPKPAWVPMPSRGLLRQQRGYAFPQVIRDKIIRHPADLADEDHRLPADTPTSF